MFHWIFKKEDKTKSEKQESPFVCKNCGFTCESCDAAPLCYACYTGRDTFCPNCQSEVSKQK